MITFYFRAYPQEVNTSNSESGGPDCKPRPSRCFLRQRTLLQDHFVSLHQSGVLKGTGDGLLSLALQGLSAVYYAGSRQSARVLHSVGRIFLGGDKLPCFVTFPVSRALGPRLKGRAEKLCNFIGYNFEFFLVKSNSGWVECKVQEEVDSCHVDEIRRSKCLWWTRENSVRGSSLLCFSIVSSLFSFFNLKHFSATYI